MSNQFSFKQIIDMVSAVRLMRFRDNLNPREAWLLFCVTHAARSHAQLFQDLWVLHETGEQRNGFFVEFGAANGVRYSNTLLLEQDYGWTGLLAEPARSWYPAIRENRTATVDERCVWSRSGETVEFVEQANALHSGMQGYSIVDNDATTRTYAVQTVSLNDLLTQHGAPRRIDFLSLDTEGSELEILEAFDFDHWDVRLIAVEHNHLPARAQLYKLLTAKGYVRKLETLSDVDDFYVKAEPAA
ncbi:MAG: FkbM family methyltransferase [Brevundimonas sp.]|uniref:FkbM family methyltransferase n=1 Tax=Brevundimonas sp. TaxID=1871086 RepID=UPI002735F586|nr:FkbM family methyltransferase [Brevundimonas sp.]MDP3405750.1 FkbM family methyltransferase [Brevundimonas sp.]